MKKLIYLLLVTVLLLSVGGCTPSESETSDSQGSSAQFSRYNQSYLAQECSFDRVFYVKASDLDKWSEENISSSYLKIGLVTVPVSVSDITISDEMMYDKYYVGSLVISGELQESSGEASLIIQFNEEEESHSFALGNMSVIDASEQEDTDISDFVCGGIVAVDETDQIITYGVMIHCCVENEIQITQVGFGLENIGLDASRCIIYSPDDYHNTIEAAIDDGTFDEYADAAYEIADVDSVNIAADVTLEAGEYYLYFPVVTTDDNEETIDQGTISVQYLDADGDSKTIAYGCWPFFSTSYQTEDVLDAWFAE